MERHLQEIHHTAKAITKALHHQLKAMVALPVNMVNRLLKAIKRQVVSRDHPGRWHLPLAQTLNFGPGSKLSTQIVATTSLHLNLNAP